MKRVFLSLLLCAGFLALNHRAALAYAEFCPARLNIQKVDPASDGSAQVYGFELEAYGPRTVLASLAFDTAAGWFTADLPRVDLTEKDRTYYGPWTSFVRREWASPVMYLRFPSSVRLESSWVNTAQSQGDSFGWQSQGLFQCLPPPPGHTRQAPPGRPMQMFTTHALDVLHAPPAADAVIIAPKASKPLEKTDCAQPSSDATVLNQARPQYPQSARGLSTGTRTVDVTVAITADGTLADAWVSGPSGVAAFDDAALSAAKGSTYKNAVAYCQNVPSTYLFKVTFKPNM